MAVTPQNERPYNLLLNGQTVFLAAALLLPGLVPSIFGWLSGLIATPVFCLLCLNGREKGTLLVRNGILLAAAAAIALKMVPSLLFSLTMVPLGFSFCRSLRLRENEIRTGINGTLVLAVTWIIFWIGYGAVQNMNPYRHLLEMLDTGFAQTYEYYRMNSDLPADSLMQLEQGVQELRRIIPAILPAMLCCMVVATVWINLVFSASLLARIQPSRVYWKKYGQWRLPDKFVWVLIGSGAFMLIGHGKPEQAAIALFLTAALLYFFQGLAVFIHMLEKWKVPVYLRILIYGILILQSYGLILLTLLGLGDVWFDFRSAPNADNTNGN